MIVIFNLAGLLIGAAGVLLGLVFFVLTGLLSAGILALATVWIVLGFLWRFWNTPSGTPRRYPSLFFIPLPFLAMPLILLGILCFPFEFAAHTNPGGPAVVSRVEDSRAAMLKADKDALDGVVYSGDIELSRSLGSVLTAMLSKEAKPDAYHIFTRVNADSVLVLVKVPNLKSYSDAAREQLLEAIDGFLAVHDGTEGKQAYIGVKGNFTFGAIQRPPKRIETGAVLVDSSLYGFYGQPPEIDHGPSVADFKGYPNKRGEPKKSEPSEPVSTGDSAEK